MILSEEKRAAMLEAAKPLIKWLNENCHPHCTARVDQTTVELSEAVAVCKTDDYILD